MPETHKILDKHCYNALYRVAKSKGFADFNIEIESASAKGDNFMGEIYKVTLKEKNTNTNLSLIMKIAPRDYIRDQVPVQFWYNREIVAYKEVFEVFNELQDNCNVGSAAKFYFVKCYDISNEFMKELLVLENLQAQGFELLGRNRRVEFQHAAPVLASVAKLHALSFVLKKQDPSTFMELANKVPDFMAGQNIYEDFLEKSLSLAVKSSDKLLHTEKLIKFKGTYLEVTRKCLEIDDYSVIYHGDCWINNTLFKFQDGEPVEVRLIDFQMLRYGPPTIDIMYFLFTSTDGEFRKTYYSRCIDHYYFSLTVALQEFSLSVEDIFPRYEFEQQIKRIALYGFGAGIAFCKLIILEGDECLDVGDLIDSNELSAPKGKALDRYSKRLNELVQDCIDYGFL